ncbi:MAG: hypothetical protein ACRDTH_28755 [Pseudonocardiaceae bacterium]
MPGTTAEAVRAARGEGRRVIAGGHHRGARPEIDRRRQIKVGLTWS